MTDLLARTRDGGSLALSAAELQALGAALRGDLVRPNEAGYDQARSVWNAMIDRRPALVARCLGAGDVIAAVDFARERGLALTIKGGGHNIAGLAVADGGMMLDLSRMRGVWVDPRTGLARAQAGCLLGDVDRETQLHGLAAVLGFVSNTGVAGLTLGGGFGYLTRRFGWTSDTVRSMQVVTADGRFIRAAEDEHPELFWALRGGGGNFGVVTDFAYELYPVGPEIVAGAIAWPAEAAPAVLEMYRELVATAPPELTCVAALRLAPPAPWLPAALHGRLVVMIVACHSGPSAAGERAVAAPKAFGQPAGDVIQRRSYCGQQMLLDATQPAGRRYYWKSEYLPAVEPAFLEAALAQAERIRSPHSGILIFPLDGALNGLPEDHSAVGNRGAAAVVNIAAAWDDAAEDALHIAWAREAWQALRAYSTGGTYINFQTEDEGEERIRAAYGANFARLVEVKRRWDPENLFRANKNIAPG